MPWLPMIPAASSGTGDPSISKVGSSRSGAGVSPPAARTSRDSTASLPTRISMSFLLPTKGMPSRAASSSNCHSSGLAKSSRYSQESFWPK